MTPSQTSTEAPDRSGFRYWEVKTPVDSVFVEEHISYVIEKLGDGVRALRDSDLLGLESVEVIIFVIAKVSESDVGIRMCLNPATSKALAELNVALVIDG